jgi:predicted phosphodiesterase
MKYAILSDVHGNLEAFQAVLKDLSQEKVDQVFFLGDIVGYGADPDKCIDNLQELTSCVVAGNHDWAAVGLTDSSHFNHAAKTAVEWTARKISADHQEFLKKLPLLQNHPDLTLVHAAPNQPEAWDYVHSHHEASLSFQHFDQQICFIGHSHTPVAFEQNEEGTTYLLPDTTFTLRDSYRYIINTGSVGQPRDGDPRSAYGIYNQDDSLFTLKRIPYNIKRAQKKILEAGLPQSLALRLAAGR